MDPLTHTLAGATIAWSIAGGSMGRRALVLGAAAALLPDSDVFIRSASDPLLAIEHHRGFTHSLLFAAAAGSAVGLAFARRTAVARAAAAGAAAWMSHSLLDASTTYGTQLFWPFSRMRVGFDIISIIDPLFTLVFVIAVAAAFRSRRAIVFGCLAAAAVWLSIGAIQKQRAIDAQRQIASARGHAIGRGAVFPTVGNTIVWRSIYETRGTLTMDRIRVPWFGAPSVVRRSSSVPLLTHIETSDPRIRRDFARFAWFSDGWVARDPAEPAIIGDARYSLQASRWVPVWGVRFDPAQSPPTEWIDNTRRRNVAASELWRDLLGPQ